MATLFRQLDVFHSDAPHSSATGTVPSQKPGASHYQPQIPQEIFDHIIDHFYDQPEALRACALVSPPWLASARAHLFYRITLGPPQIPQRSGFFVQKKTIHPCQKLHELINAQISSESRLGGIAQYIREVHLNEGVLKRQWIAQERTLPSLLRRLDNVRRLEITGAASMHIDWQGFSADVKSALVDHTFRLQSFSELKLSSFLFQDFKDMATILSACRNLRTLEVNHILFLDESAITFDEETDKWSSLDTLVIGPRISTAFITPFLVHPSAPITVNTVRKLSMSISKDFAKFAKLLHASTSVERLELTLMSDVNLQAYLQLSPDDCFQLRQVPHLRDLKVNIDILQKMEDPLPWLSALLSTGAESRQNAVETISVLYSLYLPSPYMDRYTYHGLFNKWSEIDAILCGADTSQRERERESCYGYKSLTGVKLDFALENPIGFGVAPRFLNELVLESPGLKSKGILHVHAFDTSR